MAYQIDGYTFITSMLTAPPSLLNVSNLPDPVGTYTFGDSDFKVAPLRVASIFRRALVGEQEDFLLGVLCVLIIALVTEIVHVVLLRTRKARPTRSGVQTAFVLDELTHFRNVFTLLNTKSRRSPQSRSRACASIIVLFLAAMLLGLEVIAVYLTQPVKVFTGPYDYNLIGFHPTATSAFVAAQVDKLSAKKRCITPSMSNSFQSREFSITACITRSYTKALTAPQDLATYVQIGSWYHKAGSDHRIVFGDASHTAGHTLFNRASIMKGTGKNPVTNGILFNTLDDDAMSHARHNQMFMIYSAMQWACNNDFGTLESRNCTDLVKELTVEYSRIEETQIEYWEQKNRPEMGTERGLVTRFSINLRQPFVALEKALPVLATSAVIREVKGPGKYINMENGQEETAMGSLASEEARVAGTLALILLFALLLVLLMVLRMVFKPLYLARLAQRRLEEEAFFDDNNEFADNTDRPTVDRREMMAAERDIAEAEMYDMESYINHDTEHHETASPPYRIHWWPWQPREPPDRWWFDDQLESEKNPV